MVNVCHRFQDIHNLHSRLEKLGAEAALAPVATDPADLVSMKQYVGNSSLLKAAGCTPQERASFSRLLEDSGAVDLFIKCHGAEAAGHFSYFSGRFPANRAMNKGLRLDYFLGSASGGLPAVLECYICPAEPAVSDHCPIVLVLGC